MTDISFSLRISEENGKVFVGAEKYSCWSYLRATLHNADWCSGVVVQLMEEGSMGWNCLQVMERGRSLLLCTRSTYLSLHLHSPFSLSPSLFLASRFHNFSPPLSECARSSYLISVPYRSLSLCLISPLSFIFVECIDSSLVLILCAGTIEIMFSCSTNTLL